MPISALVAPPICLKKFSASQKIDDSLTSALCYRVICCDTIHCHSCLYYIKNKSILQKTALKYWAKETQDESQNNQ